MSNTRIPAAYQPREQLLAGKNILITGAGDGIGRGAALTFARYGATVILLGRTVEKLEAVYDAIIEQGGAEPAIYPLDLATAGNAEGIACAEAIGAVFPALHGLLHNAALLGERRPIESASFDTFAQVMQVNVNAQFLLTRHLLPLLQQAERSSIVFTSSGVGRVGKAYWGAYAVSKFATEGLMQVLASELENTSNIRVNSLNPGATNTAMRRTAYPGEDPRENPTAQDIMPTYLYLMGDDSIGINGEAFNAQ